MASMIDFTDVTIAKL